MNIDSLLSSGKKVYFIGIGGISMSGLAQLAQGYGFEVYGSDMHPSERTEALKNRGIKIYDSQVKENILEVMPDFIVKTAAILPKNPEVAIAIENNIKIYDRAEFLGIITESYDAVINISGTHGKTTTTSMTSLMLLNSDKDPTVHLGAEFYAFNDTIRLGSDKKLLVSEACEFNRSFLNFRSTTAAITNIDHDHVDCYPKLSDVVDVFAKFLEKLDDNGNVVITGREPNTAESITQFVSLNPGKKINVITCSVEDELCSYTGEKGMFRAVDVNYIDGLPSYDLYYLDAKLGSVSLRVPGKHNIDNSLIAAACAYLNGATPEGIVKALNEFNGADGRYTIKGKYKGATVVVDYAHHPAAARATMEAASHIPHHEILVVFQPLTFNRTKMLFDDYVSSLLPCKKVLFGEIFSDREVNTGEISSKDIADKINEQGGDAEFYEKKEDILPRIDELISEDDIILILGPEDIRSLGDVLCPKA
ncbi:MAG: UDP-N-acetylmuramate--L-alanine ligase [Clostridia bacterium]|nr:UDP-N-acetylmuramate--L-alanine ligase [Clostridia bacterium]